MIFLTRAGGHTHLILAGSPRITARVRQALPKHLAVKLVDTVTASGSDQISDVIAATINSFIDQEEIESQEVVERLLREINTSGLAVAGTLETLNALQRSQVDVLVMAKDYGPEPGWSCPKCGAVGLAPQILIVCSACGEAGLREIDLKAELARMAEQGDCQVEVVNYSDALMQLGGVGALLRYLSPEQYAWRGTAESANRWAEAGASWRGQSIPIPEGGTMTTKDAFADRKRMQEEESFSQKGAGVQI